MARFDQPIEPMTLGNMRASSGCGRSTFRAGIASIGLSAPIAGLMRSQYRRSDRGWCAPAAGSSVLMPDRTGDGFTIREPSGLMIDGHATVVRKRSSIGGRETTVLWMSITDAGRKAMGPAS
jgi:hypothetical protein